MDLHIQPCCNAPTMQAMQRVAAHFGIAPACATLETHQCYITESYLLIFYIIKANERMVGWS